MASRPEQERIRIELEDNEDPEHLMLEVFDVLENWTHCDQPYSYITPTPPTSSTESLSSDAENHEAKRPSEDQGADEPAEYVTAKMFTQLSKLGAAVDGVLLNVIGVITSFTPIKETKGRDKLLILHIKDPSNYPNTVQVAYFKPCKSQFPPIQSIDDILILYNVKCKMYQGKAELISNHQSSFIILHSAMTMDNIQDKLKDNPHREELVETIHQLKTWL